ncbi:MAG: hypothetical protein GY870_15670 [archaeon]|nr:hypothetical protein [archaeon]
MKIKCLRCFKEWDSKYDRKPKTCAYCKSPYYEKPLTDYWAKIREKNKLKKEQA